MALLSTLQDTFVGPALNTTLWTQFTGGSATMSYGNGVSCVFPATSSSTTDGDLTSVASYDLTNSYAFMQIPVMPNGATTADGELRLQTAANNYIRWVFENGTIFAQYDVVGSKSTPFLVAYNGSTHAWLQIREGTGANMGGIAGTTYWDTSSDGINWVNRASVATPITITGLTVFLGGTTATIQTNSGVFTFRYFNTPISEGIYNHLRVGDGMSRSEVMN